MSEMWEHHKPFSVAVLVWLAGGLLFLLAVRMPLAGPVEALRNDAGGASVPSQEELLKHYAPADGMSIGGKPFADGEAVVKRDGARLDAALKAATTQIEFRPAPGFVVAPNAPQRAWEYTRIRDALRSLGHDIGRSSIQGMLNESGLDPAPRDRCSHR